LPNQKAAYKFNNKLYQGWPKKDYNSKSRCNCSKSFCSIFPW